MSVERKMLLIDRPICGFSRRISLSSPPEADSDWMFEVWHFDRMNSRPVSLSENTPVSESVGPSQQQSWMRWHSRESCHCCGAFDFLFFILYWDDVVKGLWVNCWSQLVLTTNTETIIVPSSLPCEPQNKMQQNGLQLGLYIYGLLLIRDAFWCTVSILINYIYSNGGKWQPASRQLMHRSHMTFRKEAFLSIFEQLMDICLHYASYNIKLFDFSWMRLSLIS